MSRKAKLAYDESDLSDEDDSDEDDVDENMLWVSWFCRTAGHEFFCKVDQSYITDDFNLIGLRNYIPVFEQALDLIIEDHLPADDVMPREEQKIIETAAEQLYGLIHARYIVTTKGLLHMIEKFQRGDFGVCPRTLCKGQPVVPVGQADIPRQSKVRVFCPRCNEIYFPKDPRTAALDGAYYGTTFAHLMFLLNPHLLPEEEEHSVYIPRIYGFKIHSSWKEDYQEAQQRLQISKRNLMVYQKKIQQISNNTKKPVKSQKTPGEQT